MKAARRMLFAKVDGNHWHLRRENGGGALIINGSKVIKLNRTAFDYVWSYLRWKNRDNLAALFVAAKYRLRFNKAKSDWQDLKRSLFLGAENCCEASGLRAESEEKEPVAPIRVDLALTYLCNNDCFHCYAGGSRKTQELTTSQWKTALNKLWDFGVPQVAFTGGESLLRQDLPVLVAHAKKLGMIVGLITNGRLLTKDKVTELENAGLDFVQITIESHEEAVHNRMVGRDAFSETISGIKNSLDSSLKVTTNTTMTVLNANTVLDTVKILLEMGVTHIGLNGLIRAQRGIGKEGLSPMELESILDRAKTLCAEFGAELIWFTPTCYKDFNPLKESLGTKRCSAASTVLAIEPDGRVIPCQSYFQGIGSILSDPLHKIWQHPLAQSLRRREWLDDDCKNCSHLPACGGSCPLESAAQTLQSKTM
jgi:radical SAM protein with 4Fe4S-binding SPASM domain